MSNKTESILEKAKAAGGKILRVTHPARSGKTAAAAALEVANEMSVYPPATAEEAFAFCDLQSKRCIVNLANAKDRGDNRAVANLERKLAVYQYLKERCLDAMTPPPGTRSCPNCLTHSVDIFGHCSCCDRNW